MLTQTGRQNEELCGAGSHPVAIARILLMKVFTAKVVDGRLDLAGTELPDGVTVTLLVPDEEDEGFELSAQQRAALDESIRQAERGETVDAWEFLESLKR
jgi:hypothetical protein